MQLMIRVKKIYNINYASLFVNQVVWGKTVSSNISRERMQKLQAKETKKKLTINNQRLCV